MQVFKRLGEAHADIDAQAGFQAHAYLAVRAQGARFVFDGVDFLAGDDIVPELHHIIVEGGTVGAAPDVEDVDKRVVVAGDGFKFQDALELALEGALVVEVLAPDDFHGTHGTRDAARHPHLSVGSAADLAQDVMVRDVRVSAVRGGHNSQLSIFNFQGRAGGFESLAGIGNSSPLKFGI